MAKTLKIAILVFMSHGLVSCQTSPSVRPQVVCPAPKPVVIPYPNKALFPDAPTIARPVGVIHSVVVASVINAGNALTAEHNVQIDKNWQILRDEQQAAVYRQNEANYKAWLDCPNNKPSEPEGPKRWGLF